MVLNNWRMKRGWCRVTENRLVELYTCVYMDGLYVLDWLCVIHQTTEYDHTVTFSKISLTLTKQHYVLYYCVRKVGITCRWRSRFLWIKKIIQEIRNTCDDRYSKYCIYTHWKLYVKHCLKNCFTSVVILAHTFMHVYDWF